MSLSGRLRRSVRRTLEDARLASYAKPRRFPVQYDVTVRNHSGHAKRFFIALPIPPTTVHQHVLHEPIFKPDAFAIRTDERFGNRYAVLQEELRPDGIVELQESFVVLVRPFASKVPGSADLRAYMALDRRDDVQSYLAPNRYIQSQDPEVVRLARELVGSARDVSTVLKRLNRGVIRMLAYGDPIQGLYSSLDALSRRIVDCGGFDTLLAALCMAQGIPVRVASGFWAEPKKTNQMHAWLEIMLPDGSWLPADPSVEFLARRGRTKKSGRLGFVGSDRVVLSYGCDIPLQLGRDTVAVDILQHPYVWSEDGSEGLETSVAFRVPKVWRE